VDSDAVEPNGDEEWFWSLDGDTLANVRFPIASPGFDRRAVLSVLNEAARLIDALRAELAERDAADAAAGRSAR
jgi:hypothetical protein